jgi:arylsulfatase A-like enzyme
VTADHGEEFREHGQMGHGQQLYNETVRVPLILLAPGYQGGRVVEENTSLIDIAPTLLDLAAFPRRRDSKAAHSFRSSGVVRSGRRSQRCSGARRRRQNPPT